MSDQPTKASLYRKIAAVAGAIEAVEKDGRNKDQGYRYATPASVMSAVKPLMAAQHLAIVPCLVAFEAVDTGQTSRSGTPYILNRVAMEYLILDGETGEDMTVKWQAQAGTYGDDKGLAKAQTIALRTFLLQLFQIPAEDPESDPDAAGRAPQAPQRGAAYDPRPAPVKAPEKPQEAPYLTKEQQSALRKAEEREAKARGDQARIMEGKPAKRPPTRQEYIDKLKVLWRRETDLGMPTPATDLAIDLDNEEEATIEAITALGKAAAKRVKALESEAAEVAKL